MGGIELGDSWESLVVFQLWLGGADHWPSGRWTIGRLPRANVLDAEGGRKAVRVGQAEPVRHSFAVEVEMKRLLPEGVFQFPDHLAIDIPFDRLDRPFQGIDVIVVREREGRGPDSGIGQMLVILGSAEDMAVGMEGLRPLITDTADFENIDFRP